jgi:hypothetical protein
VSWFEIGEKGGLMRSRTVTNAVSGVALTNPSHADGPYMRGLVLSFSIYYQ